ncbi:hypothetical protein HDV63DRAFT_369412 [Trichoderma sp. SZMC 28014]
MFTVAFMTLHCATQYACTLTDDLPLVHMTRLNEHQKEGKKRWQNNIQGFTMSRMRIGPEWRRRVRYLTPLLWLCISSIARPGNVLACNPQKNCLYVGLGRLRNVTFGFSLSQ